MALQIFMLAIWNFRYIDFMYINFKTSYWGNWLLTFRSNIASLQEVWFAIWQRRCNRSVSMEFCKKSHQKVFSRTFSYNLKFAMKYPILNHVHKNHRKTVSKSLEEIISNFFMNHQNLCWFSNLFLFIII